MVGELGRKLARVLRGRRICDSLEHGDQRLKVICVGRDDTIRPPRENLDKSQLFQARNRSKNLPFRGAASNRKGPHGREGFLVPLPPCGPFRDHAAQLQRRELDRFRSWEGCLSSRGPSSVIGGSSAPSKRDWKLFPPRGNLSHMCSHRRTHVLL